MENKKKDGPFKEYYENGELKEEGSFKKGKKQGLWKLYSKNGKSGTESYYNDDELV